MKLLYFGRFAPVEFNEIKGSIPEENKKARFLEIELPDIIFSEARQMLVDRGQKDLKQADLGVFTAAVCSSQFYVGFYLRGKTPTNRSWLG